MLGQIDERPASVLKSREFIIGDLLECSTYDWYLVVDSVGAYQRHHRKTAMMPTDANWGDSISWTMNKSASARNTAVAFYPKVYRGVIYISAGKAVSEEI